MIILPVSIPILDRLNLQAALGNFAVITDFGDFVSSVLNVILIIASIATLLYLVWGGLNWIMAGGDKTKVEEARNRITNAVIGLLIVAASWAIFLFINWFLGLGVVGVSGLTGGTGSGTSDGTGGTSTTCANNIAIGACGQRTFNGDWYRCLPANSTCSTSGSSYPYPFLCLDNATCP